MPEPAHALAPGHLAAQHQPPRPARGECARAGHLAANRLGPGMSHGDTIAAVPAHGLAGLALGVATAASNALPVLRRGRLRSRDDPATAQIIGPDRAARCFR
jgi:hypothetical protein